MWKKKKKKNETVNKGQKMREEEEDVIKDKARRISANKKINKGATYWNEPKYQVEEMRNAGHYEGSDTLTKKSEETKENRKKLK